MEGKGGCLLAFSYFKKRAMDLDDITSRQESTNPSCQDLVVIMSLQSGLQEERVRVEGELNFFLNYDATFFHQPRFYVEISRLGGTLEATVDEALSKSERFL